MQLEIVVGMTAAAMVFIALNPIEVLVQTVYSLALGVLSVFTGQSFCTAQI
jgi:hypothetical protein